MRFTKAIPIFGLSLTLALGGCADLAVENLNAPDEELALSEPGDVEALIGSSFAVFWRAVSDFEPQAGLSTLADEWSASWGNFGMQDLSSEPRRAINNDAGYNYRSAISEAWNEVYEAVSNANDGLKALNNIGTTTDIDVERARAFAKMVQAVGHGYLSGLYDRGFVYKETMDLEETEFTLVEYDVMNDSALVMFDEAIALAEAATFTTVPSEWIGNIPGFTRTDLIEMLHALKARYRVAVARTPAERAAVDWTAVIADVEAANGQELRIIGDDFERYWEYPKLYSHYALWSRSDMRFVGPADQSGQYQAWLQTPVQDRMPVIIESPDLRVFDPAKDCSPFPVDAGGGAERCGTYFVEWTPQNFRADRGTYHYSNYVNNRWEEYADEGWRGWVGEEAPFIIEAELDLLKAEGLIRTNGLVTEIAPLINKTRVANGGLDPVPATASMDELRAAVVYEKRFEAAFMSGLVTFSDMRGWGYLTVNSPLHYPIPASELETLQLPVYSFGGADDPEWAATQSNCWVAGPADVSGNTCNIPVLNPF